MIVNLYDSRGLAGDWQYTTPRNNIIRLVAGRQESLNNILRRVIEACQGPGSIWLLRIIAHGNSGFIQLGRENLNTSNAQQLSTLRNYFTSNGIGIAIHSCGSASDTPITGEPNILQRIINYDVNKCDLHSIVPGTIARGGGRGVNFLRAISRSSRTVVRGGINVQSPDSRFRFEGNSIAVFRDRSTIVVPDYGRLALDSTRIINH